MHFGSGKKYIRPSLRIIAAVMLAAAMFAMLTACPGALPGGNSNDSNNNPTVIITTPPPKQTTTETLKPGTELSPSLPPMIGPPAIPIVLNPEASGTKVEENEYALIDYSNIEDGYVMVKWLGGKTEKGVRVQIHGQSDIKHPPYILNDAGEFEVYPLSDGNGTYTIKVVEKLDDSRGVVSLSLEINVTLKDEFAPFLRPNQYVNFDEDCKSVALAAELITAQSGFIEKIAAVYDYVIHNLTYDTDLANEIVAGMHPNYLPDIDEVLSKRKGICFDYAALMAAMLRSQGIPTQLVVGDVNGNLRHAWLNVYSEEDGWIDAVIFFDGNTWKMMDPTFASSLQTSDALVNYIGDGSNYTEMYLY